MHFAHFLQVFTDKMQIMAFIFSILVAAQYLFLKSRFFKKLMQEFYPCISEISHSPKKDAGGGPETYLPIGVALCKNGILHESVLGVHEIDIL